MGADWNKVEKDVTAFGVKVYPLEECIIGDCLGSGSTMEVFEGKCNINTVTRNVAFKHHKGFRRYIVEQEDVDKILQYFRHEITLMKRLKYPTNIVQIYGVTFENKMPVLIVELGNQTLSRYLLDKAESGTPATWHEKIKLCNDVSRGIRCFHDAEIIHGDIKGDNVLVFIESIGITTAKLSGFGYPSTFNSSDGGIGRNKISMAPETRGIEELKEWEEKPTQDIFNFGLVIYQIANDGKTPHEGPEEILKVDSINSHIEVLLANLRPDTPEAFRRIITSTTKYIPTERAPLDIAEKIISDFRNVSSLQLARTANIPLQSLGSYTTSSQSLFLPPPALEITPHSLPDSKKFYHDELNNNLKTAELDEAKRSYEKAKNTLESYIILNDVLDIDKLPIPPSLKPSIFYEYQQLAEIGDTFAQYMSGVCWINGFGTEKNDLKAVECFAKAAKAGIAPAQNNLGVSYEEGRGVIKDISKAIEWYTMAAEAGNPKAQRNLGCLYELGEGVSEDYLKAAEWYIKAAEANYSPAQNELGILYEKGRGVPMDLTKAFELYKKAAEGGNLDAQRNLGLCYEYGKGVTEDSLKAAEWYEVAAESGHARAQNNLGLLYEKGNGITKNYKIAFEWYKKGAEGGDSWAQHNLGNCYQYGNGVSRNELKAIEWYTKSAESGNTSGLNSLAYCYEKGIGITKDYSKAIELYSKAVKTGNISARVNLDSLRRYKII